MRCRDFEAVLELFVAAPRAPAHAEARAHLRTCESCRELVELARLASEPEPAAAPPADLVSSVLQRTSGPACGAAEDQLHDHLAGQLTTEDARLVEHHLGSCSDCRALTRVLVALRRDLPTLAVVQPDDRFVADVLRATLPLGARFVRWRRLVWPQWIERPRFAVEAAYALTLVLVLVFSLPGTPLEAMPRDAVRIARSAPGAAVGEGIGRLESAASSGLSTLRSSDGARALTGAVEDARAAGERGWTRVLEAAEAAPGWTVERLRTLRAWLASVLEKADDDSTTAGPQSDEER